METYIHSRIYKLRGSPAWKHTFTQEDIQAMWESSINTIGYSLQALWESSMETHIHTIEYTHSLHRRRFGPDLGGGGRSRIIILKPV